MSKSSSNVKVLRFLHSLCQKYFPLMILCAVFKNITPYFNIYMSAEIINEISNTREVNKIIILVCITVFGNFFISICDGILSREFNHASTRMNQKEQQYFNNKVLSLPYEELESSEIRQLRRKINESAKINNHGKQALINNIDSLLYNTINIIFAMYLFIEMIVLILNLNFDFIVVVFIGIFIILTALNIWIVFISSKKMSTVSNEASQTMIEENRIDDAIDSYNMGKDVRIYRQDKIIMNVKLYAFELHKKVFKKINIARFKTDIPESILSVSVQISIYIFVCIYVINEVLGVGSIIKYIGFTQRLINAIIGMFRIVGQIKYNTSFVDDYLKFVDLKHENYCGTLSISSINVNDLKIRFENVSFKYPGSDTYALKNIQLELRTGHRTAIVGMNGSGKTTMIKLLLRMYEPTIGCITINGVDIRNFDYNDYLLIFSVVFQDFKLFSFSLGQNVASSAMYEDIEVLNVLNKSGFADRLLNLEKGLNTALYKNFETDGIEISGGEAQKIALARALYKQAPIIILDEPTAALDPIAEYEIYSKFDDIVENRTVIYISHRLSSCRFCDDIIVFHQGELIQQGSHDVLINEKHSKYYELWNAQAQHYIN